MTVKEILWELLGYGIQSDGSKFYPDEYVENKINKAIKALNTNHCIDCCCAKSWEALGKKDYTGKSIPEEIEKLVLESNANYIRGLKAGVRLYAWWKNGIQYVGTCGTTLKHALEKIDE